MDRNIIQEIFNVIYKKYRINYSKKEVKIALIITIFIYYIVEHKEEYQLNLNSILEKEVISSLVKIGKEGLIEREIIKPTEDQLKLNNHISNVYRNLKVIKDIKFMEEICEYISHYQEINVLELVEFINLEIEKDEIKEGKSINKLIKKIIQKREESVHYVLDNFSGIGESIFSTMENKLVYIQLQDIDEIQCAISTIILIMYGYKNFKVINTNTLTYNDDKKFDLIISIPPLIMDTTQIKYNNIDNINKRDNWGGVKVSFEKLNEFGEFITLVNTGALTSGKKADKYMREELIKRKCIKAIIELPERMLNGTNIKTSLLIIEKKYNKEIILINLDSEKGQKYLQKNPFETVEITEEGIKEIFEILYENKVSEIAKKIDKNDLLENLELLPSLYIFQGEEYEYKDLGKLKQERHELKIEIEILEEKYEQYEI